MNTARVAFWLALIGMVPSLAIGFLHAEPGRTDDRLDGVDATAMVESNYSVSSTNGEPGYHLRSKNVPKKISEQDLLEKKKLTLVAFPEPVLRYRPHLQGIRITVVNASNDIVRILALDSRIPIIQEAQDAAGNWKPIEFFNWQTDCGNSFHKTSLEPAHYWELVAPRYAGSLKTKLRFALLSPDQREKPIYSNEFDGTIRPDQFTRKPGEWKPVNFDPPRQP